MQSEEIRSTRKGKTTYDFGGSGVEGATFLEFLGLLLTLRWRLLDLSVILLARWLTSNQGMHHRLNPAILRDESKVKDAK